MKAIKAGTKASKFTVDVVYYCGVYYIPSTARYEDGIFKMNGLWYRKGRFGKWLEDTFRPEPRTGDLILNFAESKGLNINAPNNL